MDPPYQLEAEPQILQVFNGMDSITEYTTIVIEAGLKRDLSFIEECGYTIIKLKTYKTNQHVFIRKK